MSHGRRASTDEVRTWEIPTNSCVLSLLDDEELETLQSVEQFGEREFEAMTSPQFLAGENRGENVAAPLSVGLEVSSPVPLAEGESQQPQNQRGQRGNKQQCFEAFGAFGAFGSSVAQSKSPSVALEFANGPWLYLYGVSTGQMRQAVGALVGEQAARGLSANVVSRLKRSWDEEYRQWCRGRLDDDWVYLWADGIYSALRGDRERLCVLVVIGVNARGEKHFLAIEDGVRESTQSWREVLLGMKQRGFTRPAKLAVGDGAMGFWWALSEVFPSTRTQRCWMHKTGNVLNYLPKSAQAKAKQGLHEIWMAETRAKASAMHALPTTWIYANARFSRRRSESLSSSVLMSVLDSARSITM